jgi:hypothetical protein
MSSANTTRRSTGYIFPTLKKSSNLEHTYAMLPYVTNFWVHHSSQMPVDPMNVDAFSHVVLYHQLPFDFRPWELDEEHRMTPDMAFWFPIYVWAMQNCMTSLFSVLVRDKEIRKQITAYFGQLGNSTITIDNYLAILSTYELGSWTWKVSEAANTSAGRDVVRLLLTELEKHCPSISTAYLDPLIIDALCIAIKQGKPQAAVTINRHYVPNIATLTHLFIEMLNMDHVPAPVIASLLCTPTDDGLKNDDEFFLAFEKFMGSLVEVLSTQKVSTLKLNHWCGCIFLCHIMDIENVNWLRIVLDHISERSFHSVQGWGRFVRDTPLAKSFSLCYQEEKRSRHSVPGVLTHDMSFYEKLLTKLIPFHSWDRFPASAFENAEIRCLQWASRSDMVEVVQALIPYYKEYLIFSAFEPQRSFEVLDIAMRFSTRSFVMLVQKIPWSKDVVKLLFEDPFFQDHRNFPVDLWEIIDELADKHSRLRHGLLRQAKYKSKNQGIFTPDAS